MTVLVMSHDARRAAKFDAKLHYNKAPFILEPTPVNRPLAGERVEIYRFPAGA
ncbi:hypothetical protein V474_15820 [Novosphingobium barchaimii LL02]|uniref:Uncharacterized protein n=1 Tax=Novosphingobium barchaimii LL02 TaxID=1114963 RepID=A0A0J8AQI1_9SPHN|nr:hypothetical protein [Novosphingobium barchaimii]KMS56675.1 hypothetical protein V474_15820 [Novosphingobium barchaimii LL02]